MLDLRAFGALSILLALITTGPARATVIACAAMPAEGVCAEPLEAPAAAETVADVAAPPPTTDGDRAEREGGAATARSGADEPAPHPAMDGDRAKPDKEAAAVTPESQAEKTAKAEVGGAIDSICLILESAATANGLPLEFFARVIWQESQFQPNTVGPTTRGGHRAQGIAQFMPYTAAQRGLLDPFNPQTALPHAAEFLAELRGEFGNLGLAAAAYNAGPGRVRNFIGRRGGLPAQTRNYVRAVTGRSVDEWAALGRVGGKDGIPKPTSCGQLAALLQEQPSFFIGKVEPNVREAALRAQGIPDWPNASSGQSGASRVAARPTGSLAAPNRNALQAVLQAVLPTLRVPIPKPSPSVPSGESMSLSRTSESGQSAAAAALRATSLALMPSLSRSSPGRSRASSPEVTPRDAKTRGPALVRDQNLQALAASLPTPEGPARPPQTSPSAASAESRRSTSVEVTLSDSKLVSDRLRVHPRKGEKAAEEFRGASLAVEAEPAVQAKLLPDSPPSATTPPVPETRMPDEPRESASAWSLQLVGDSSEERALAEYKNLQEKFPAILGARPPIVIKRQLGGRGLARWYQVRVDEHSRDAADALCSRLRSAGGECLVLSN